MSYITLTVAGPDRWPDGSPPEGVDFRGYVDLAEVGRLMDTHDLLVMASRLEAFGIVVAEALARGLPCVGRRAFALPEIIEPGVTGDLFDGDDPAVLARVLGRTLADDTLVESCQRNADRAASWFSWRRAAAEMAEVATHAAGAAAAAAGRR